MFWNGNREEASEKRLRWNGWKPNCNCILDSLYSHPHEWLSAKANWIYVHLNWISILQLPAEIHSDIKQCDAIETSWTMGQCPSLKFKRWKTVLRFFLGSRKKMNHFSGYFFSCWTFNDVIIMLSAYSDENKLSASGIITLCEQHTDYDFHLIKISFLDRHRVN